MKLINDTEFLKELFEYSARPRSRIIPLSTVQEILSKHLKDLPKKRVFLQSDIYKTEDEWEVSGDNTEYNQCLEDCEGK